MGRKEVKLVKKDVDVNVDEGRVWPGEVISRQELGFFSSS